jgi:redox-sensitive bicupin YhaK (pirin superfamily)
LTAIDLTITPRDKDLGGFHVGRILPYAKQRMVGPFIFLDHMGPAEFAANQGIDVRPHPHIGLATVTYLFEGRMFHRDSIGSAQPITPGAVNWMTAGRGIVHSERTPPQEKIKLHHVHGLQSWVALPKEYEECPPEFFHHPENTLPSFDIKGVAVRLVAGTAYGHEAPVKTYSPLFYAAVTMKAGDTLEMPQEHRERALYLLGGDLRIGNTQILPRTMAVFTADERIIVQANAASTFMLLGGDPLSEPRYIDWNFVSSSKDRLEQAKQDWLNQRFDKIPGDDQEFIPLPDYPKAKTV